MFCSINFQKQNEYLNIIIVCISQRSKHEMSCWPSKIDIKKKNSEWICRIKIVVSARNFTNESLSFKLLNDSKLLLQCSIVWYEKKNFWEIEENKKSVDLWNSSQYLNITILEIKFFNYDKDNNRFHIRYVFFFIDKLKWQVLMTTIEWYMIDVIS